jgi:uncharacterized protein YfdQ (DUF2303 family)
MDNIVRASEVQAAIDAGKQLGNVNDKVYDVQADGGAAVPVGLVPHGMKLEVLTEAVRLSRKLADAPQRIAGKAEHQELDSFIAHLNRFKGAGSVVWADNNRVSLTAVVNYADRDKPAWGDHRSVYSCPLSREWGIWTANAGRPFSQDDFAEFLESHLPDIVGPGQGDDEKSYPQPIVLVQLARMLRIHVKSTYERSTNPTTGDCSLVAKTEQDEAQSTRVPPVFLIGIPVFEAGAKYRIEARLRLQLTDKKPLFSFILDQVEATKRDAFGEVRERVAKETGLPVFAGSPESLSGE